MKEVWEIMWIVTYIDVTDHYSVTKSLILRNDLDDGFTLLDIHRAAKILLERKGDDYLVTGITKVGQGEVVKMSEAELDMMTWTN